MTTIQPTHQTNHNNKISHTAIAATSLGLGSIWIHRAKEEFETPFGKELLKSLNKFILSPIFIISHSFP